MIICLCKGIRDSEFRRRCRKALETKNLSGISDYDCGACAAARVEILNEVRKEVEAHEEPADD